MLEHRERIKMLNNLILMSDSYKSTHWLQYPEGTTSLFSYVESRGGKYSHTLFFGLQYLLKEYLSQRVTLPMVDEAEKFAQLHGVPFNRQGWEYIATNLQGKLPVKICAPKEGTLIPVSNVMLTVESTDKNCFWVVSHLETMILRSVWYATTVATQSFYIKKLIMSYLEKTSDNPEAEINFKLHDFGARGVSSSESAMIGGASHLVNFMGSDTMEGVWLMNKYYDSEMSAFSIPAAEHSTITSWGKENEVEAYRNMLKRFAKPGSLVAIVSDSYDLYNAISNLWGTTLKDEVINSGATVVIRPDSGKPSEVVLHSLRLLEEKFGITYNSKGYKVLNHVRVIQGDGVNHESIREILAVMETHGFSATNVAFGMGGALLQSINRDTQMFAYKCSSATINGKQVDVFKDPVTDKIKKSKKGKLDLVLRNGLLQTIPGTENFGSVLKEVYKNGDILVTHTLEEIRKRANEYL